MRIVYPLIALASLLLVVACDPEKKPDTKPEAGTPVAELPEAAVLEYSVVAQLPHDTMSFTEGLLIHNGQLFESTGSPSGSYFRSVLGPVDLKTGKIDVKAELDKKYFGEGMIIFKNKIYQLTYTDQIGFMYDAKTYKPAGQFGYANKEGWGMTTDGEYIIMSDGTENLSYYDADFKLVKTLVVKDRGYAQENLNELEYINGFIYANIYTTDTVVKIDPATGVVVARVNLRPLSFNLRNHHPYVMETNGIAYDAANDKIYVTGKAWPFIYQINFPH